MGMQADLAKQYGVPICRIDKIGARRLMAMCEDARLLTLADAQRRSAAQMDGIPAPAHPRKLKGYGRKWGAEWRAARAAIGEPFIRGRSMADWMEMFARDEELLAELITLRETYRAEMRARMNRSREFIKKPVQSEPKPLELSCEFEQSRRVKRMMRLAEKVRVA
jgi:hypothetical protein